MRLLQKQKTIIMNKKEIKKAIESDTPINSLFSLIPIKNKKNFLSFAGKFGFTEEKINNLLKNEIHEAKQGKI